MLWTNEFTVIDIFHFAEEILDQQPDFFMGSLDVDSLFTNIPLEGAIEIFTEKRFKESKTSEGLSKSEFKEFLSPATKDSHFIFYGTLYKQIDGVATGSPLCPKLPNALWLFHEEHCLGSCPLESQTILLSQVRWYYICFI